MLALREPKYSHGLAVSPSVTHQQRGKPVVDVISWLTTGQLPQIQFSSCPTLAARQSSCALDHEVFKVVCEL